jgi:hypothetical protein
MQDPGTVGAGGGSAALSCKAEAGEACGGTRWQRERGETGGVWAGSGKEKKMGQAQRNSNFFDLSKKISNEYELF